MMNYQRIGSCNEKSEYDFEQIAREIGVIPVMKNNFLAEAARSISAMSFPSDRIDIDAETEATLIRLWDDIRKTINEKESLEGETILIPSDIFFAHTIPLMDCEISISDPDDANYPKFIARVIINPEMNWDMPEDEMLPEELIGKHCTPVSMVGVVEMKPDLGGYYKILLPLFVTSGENFVSAANWITYENDSIRGYSDQKLSLVYMLTTHMVQAWYGIQIMMMHPYTKSIFQKYKTSKEKLTKIQRKYSPDGKITRKVKIHNITSEEITESLLSSNGNQDNDDNVKSVSGRRAFIRKCLSWYVIGHWRHYSDGKRVFVKPYWKGPLRQVKMNLDGGRERTVDND